MKKSVNLQACPLGFTELFGLLTALRAAFIEMNPPLRQAKLVLNKTLSWAFFEDYKIKEKLKKGIDTPNPHGYLSALEDTLKYIKKEYEEKQRELKWTSYQKVCKEYPSHLKQSLIDLSLLLLFNEDFKKVKGYLNKILDDSNYMDPGIREKLIKASNTDRKIDFLAEISSVINDISNKTGA